MITEILELTVARAVPAASTAFVKAKNENKNNPPIAAPKKKLEKE